MPVVCVCNGRRGPILVRDIDRLCANNSYGRCAQGPGFGFGRGQRQQPEKRNTRSTNVLHERKKSARAVLLLAIDLFCSFIFESVRTCVLSIHRRRDLNYCCCRISSHGLNHPDHVCPAAACPRQALDHAPHTLPTYVHSKQPAAPEWPADDTAGRRQEEETGPENHCRSWEAAAAAPTAPAPTPVGMGSGERMGVGSSTMR